MLRIFAWPLRLHVVRAVVVVLTLAALSWFIAADWTDDSESMTGAFVTVFGVAVLGVVLIWRASVRARSRRDRTLTGLLALSPPDFEAAVARLMRRAGYRDVSVVGGSGDLMADIVARTRRGEHIVVQCKRKVPGQRVDQRRCRSSLG